MDTSAAGVSQGCPEPRPFPTTSASSAATPRDLGPGALSEAEVVTFVAGMQAAFLSACARRSVTHTVCEIGGVRLGLDFAGSELAEAFRPALDDIITSDTDPDSVDVRLSIFDVAASGVACPALGRPVAPLLDWRGSCAAAPDASATVFYDAGSAQPSVVDAAAGFGVVAIDDVRRLPAWALAAPLRSQFALLLQPHGVQLIHGAAIGSPDGVVVLTGHGGSGKSTTSLSALRRGLTVLGDDYVAVRAPAAAGALPTVHRVFSSLKVRPSELGADAGVGAAPSRDLGAVQDKVVLYPFAGAVTPPVREAPCVGFWDAQLAAGTASWVEPRHPQDVARIVLDSTALQIPGDDVELARLVLRCAESVPTVQRLHLGSDREGVVDMLEQARVSAQPASAPMPVWAAPGALRPVSVVIPVYNGAQFVAEAVANVHGQDYPVHEVIVVDDGSTDDLDAALGRIVLPFRLLRRLNGGPAAARNAGIAVATSDWIAFQDVDDLWSPGALLRLAEALVLHPDVPVVHGKMTTLQRASGESGWTPVPTPVDGFPFKINAGLYRRETFADIGGFDETLRYGEDFEWFSRLRMRHRSIMVPDVIVRRRLHESNMTNDLAAMELGTRAAYRKVLAQRVRANRAG